MRAVSILITELLIKTPWYTDQRSMPPSWREPSSPSPRIWRGRSFWFFCPIQEHKVPNVNTTELLMQKQGNLFLLLCLLSFIMRGFIQTGQAAVNTASPWACAPRLEHTSEISLSFKGSFCLVLSGTLRYCKRCQRLRDRCQCRPPWQTCHTLNAFSCPLIEQLSPLREAKCTNSITHHVLPLPSSVSPPFRLYLLIFLFVTSSISLL